MSEVKRYHVTDSGLVEGQALGRINVVLGADFDRVTAERDAALEEVEALKHWRDLALQFDNHRMRALWHLKTLVSDGAHYDAAAAFLAEPPIPQSELQQRLTAADERADVLGKALRKISRANDCGCLPCRGDCTSKLSLEIALDEIRESAASALMLSQTVAMNDVLIVGAAPMIGVTRFKP